MATKEESTKGREFSIDLEWQFRNATAKVFAVAEALGDGSGEGPHNCDYYIGNSQILLGAYDELKELEEAFFRESA